MRFELRKRLPLVLAALLGVWGWKYSGALFPVERELVWTKPSEAQDVRRLEIQIWQNGELVKRDVHVFPQGMSFDLSQKASLKQGEYEAQVFVEKISAKAQNSGRQHFVVAHEDKLQFTIP